MNHVHISRTEHGNVCDDRQDCELRRWAQMKWLICPSRIRNPLVVVTSIETAGLNDVSGLEPGVALRKSKMFFNEDLKDEVCTS